MEVEWYRDWQQVRGGITLADKRIYILIVMISTWIIVALALLCFLINSSNISSLGNKLLSCGNKKIKPSYF